MTLPAATSAATATASPTPAASTAAIATSVTAAVSAVMALRWSAIVACARGIIPCRVVARSKILRRGCIRFWLPLFRLNRFAFFREPLALSFMQIFVLIHAEFFCHAVRFFSAMFRCVRLVEMQYLFVYTGGQRLARQTFNHWT
jgi:hypothetical protein